MRGLALAAAMACGLATGAEAAVVTQVVALQPGAQQVMGRYFDTTLGTLTGTTFEFAGSYAPSFRVSGSSAVTSFTIAPRIQVQGVDYLLPSETATVSGSTGTAPAQSFDITGTLRGNFQVAAAGNLALLDAPVGLPFAVGTTSPLPSGLILADDAPNRPGGTFTLTYTYNAATAVPEPVSAGLLGVGLFALAAARKRHSI